MKGRPKILILEETEFLVGQETFVDSVAENENAVFFEDNGETGYFYAVKPDRDTTVLDALHIYDVARVSDKHKPSIIKILWTEDYSKAFLSINDYYHAIFDFDLKAGYCRNGFPECKSNWVKIKNRKLTDELIVELSKNV